MDVDALMEYAEWRTQKFVAGRQNDGMGKTFHTDFGEALKK